jgi:hypothetical protein
VSGLINLLCIRCIIKVQGIMDSVYGMIVSYCDRDVIDELMSCKLRIAGICR